MKAGISPRLEPAVFPSELHRLRVEKVSVAMQVTLHLDTKVQWTVCGVSKKLNRRVARRSLALGCESHSGEHRTMYSKLGLIARHR